MSKLKMTYEEMISRLQANTYQAPDQWMRIEDELKINDKLQELKTYVAPDDLWDKIDSELGEEPKVEETKLEEPKRKPYKRFFFLAMTLILALTIGYFQSNEDKNTEVSYSSDVIVETSNEVESTEVVDLTAAFDFIDKNDFLFTAEDKIDYEKQLQQLDEAIAEVKAMQGMYGIDKRTQKMLAKIEREKAELIKSMIKGA